MEKVSVQRANRLKYPFVQTRFTMPELTPLWSRNNFSTLSVPFTCLWPRTTFSPTSFNSNSSSLAQHQGVRGESGAASPSPPSPQQQPPPVAKQQIKVALFFSFDFYLPAHGRAWFSAGGERSQKQQRRQHCLRCHRLRSATPAVTVAGHSRQGAAAQREYSVKSRRPIYFFSFVHFGTTGIRRGAIKCKQRDNRHSIERKRVGGVNRAPAAALKIHEGVVEFFILLRFSCLMFLLI